jgi:hypothetical protein
MNRKTVIITVTDPGQNFKAWGNLRKLCKKHGFVYNTIVKKQLPITIKDVTIHRVKYEE